MDIRYADNREDYKKTSHKNMAAATDSIMFDISRIYTNIDGNLFIVNATHREIISTSQQEGRRVISEIINLRKCHPSRTIEMVNDGLTIKVFHK